MICNAILYYTLVFASGFTDGHVKYLDKVTAKQFIEILKSPEKLKEIDHNLVKATDIRVEYTKDFDCFKGPINWVK